MTLEKTRAQVTRDEMHAAIEAATAHLATRDDIKADGAQTRRHIDVVMESFRMDIRTIVARDPYLRERLRTLESSVERHKTLVDQRLLGLEAR